MQCPVCGEAMKQSSWLDEAWGSIKRIYEYDCTNMDCGEEEEEEDDED